MKMYIVRLSEDQLSALEQRMRFGTAPAQALTYARTLLKTDANGPGSTDQQIRTALGINVRQVEKVRHRFCGQGLKAAIQRKVPAAAAGHSSCSRHQRQRPRPHRKPVRVAISQG